LKHITEHQEECLEILQEECAEIIQAASKIKRFGLIGKRLDGNTNLLNLEMEIGDTLALIDLIKASGLGVTDNGIQQARNNKLTRLPEYMHTWNNRGI